MAAYIQQVKDGIQSIAAGITAASLDPIVKDAFGNSLAQIAQLVDIVGRIGQDRI